MKKLSTYPNTNADTTDNPNGTFKNETSVGAGDGTNIVAPHMTDPYYALYQVLQLAGEVPNGELENGSTSKQWITALQNVGIFKYDSAITYKKNAIVINTNSDITKFYRSKVADNTYAITNTTYWYNFATINANNTITIDIDVVNKDKNLIYGLVPSSNRTTNNTSINLTAGKCICKDSSTILSFSDYINTNLIETDNTNITSLSANATYHLFGYKRNDDSDALWLNNLLTPNFIPSGETESIIKSTNAYRRIFSFKTDANGYIREFYAYDERGALQIIYVVSEGILEVSLASSSIPTSYTDLTLSVPKDIKVKVYLRSYVDCGNNADRVLWVKDKNSNNVRVMLRSYYDTNNTNVPFIYTDTNGQIQYLINVADGNTQALKIYLMCFDDLRIND